MSQQDPFVQTGDYMPKADQPFLLWLGNFSTRISANWSMYGLGEPDAQSIAGHYQAYAAILPQSKFPSTRNSGIIAQKDAVKAAARAACRVYAMLIKSNKSVDNQAKIDLGLHVNDTTPTPIPAPTTAPMLQIKALFSGEHEIIFRDEMTPDAKRKPPGAVVIELYVHVGATATMDFNKAKFVGAYGKGPILHSFEPEDVSKVATYFARWRTLRGLAGPWSSPVCMTIAFGGPVENQMFYPSPDGGQSKQIDGEDDLKLAA
jgi:hypothetical protein